ncbi:MAG: aminopeptidase P N-terminal domain-containing protein [Deltaproteobacteria bacterium]|nr:aminopeptidase P N-terminal domain-containing protein [Deltaproteobacteria bacterium]
MHALPASSFAARRTRVRDSLPSGGAILLPTNVEQHRNGDVHYPFRPDSDFFWLTGFDEPNAWALLRKDAPSYTLFVMPKDREKEIWTGLRAGVEGAADAYGADEAYPIEELETRLATLLADVDSLYYAVGRRPEADKVVHQVLAGLRRGRKPLKGPRGLLEPSTVLDNLRLIKTPDELELMRAGAAITAEAHAEAMAQVRPGMREYEIQALIEFIFRRNGAWGWAYPSIVGGGANACILHYRAGNAELKADTLMLIDAGAEIEGYATDVTRTSPISGRFSGPQRELYELCLQVQANACDYTKPGATLQGMHDEVVRGLTDGFIQLGLLQGSVDEAIETKAFRRYYMHRTSHWLGLDVHDVGRYQMADGPGQGDNRPLEPGMVLTIEPGIYVSPDDEQAPEAYRGIGIRIEDDVLVTAEGHENLTAATPKSVADIEALQA